MSAPGERGHRTVDHTADQILEAWGPTRAACLEELVLGFVGTFAAVARPDAAQEVALRLDGGDARALLLTLLGEIILLLETRDALPAAVRIVDRGDVVEVHLGVVTTADARPCGPAPKGISHSGLDLSTSGERWHARALVDI